MKHAFADAEASSKSSRSQETSRRQRTSRVQESSRLREPPRLQAPPQTRRPASLRDEYRRYRWTSRGIGMLLCVYFAIAVWRERIPGQGEIFPFASWSLFSLVPNACEDFAVRLLSVEGTELSPPQYFESAGLRFSGATNHAAHVAIDRLGKALIAGDLPGADRVRRRFEREYLGKEARHVRYELVARVYDPFERWHGGGFRQVRTLGVYEAGAR